MVRLAKAHTDLALHVCKKVVDQICFVSYRDASGGSTRSEQAQVGYVVMALLARFAAPVTLVPWRSHRVKRVVASASAAEAMSLSEAIAQGDWVRALWSAMVLGLNLREWWRTRKRSASHIGHGFGRQLRPFTQRNNRCQ